MELQVGDDAGDVAMASCIGMPCMQYGGGAYSGAGLLESGAGGSGGGGVWRPPEHLDTVHLEDILEQVDGKQQSGVTSSVQPDPPDQSVPLLHYPLQVKEDPDWPDSPYGSDPLPLYFPHHETLADPYAHPSAHPALQYPALHHQPYPDYSQLQPPLPPPPDTRRTLQLLPAQSVANPAFQLHQQHQLHQLSYPTPFRPTHAPLRLSSSAPSYLPAAAQARHQLASFSSVSTGVVSPSSQMSLLDDGNDSHDDWDTDDTDHPSSRSRSDRMSPSADRKDRYFWQYNVHSKGPKGQRVMRSQRVTNPFQVEDAVDPVFSTHYHIEGIKHSGKARRGDGNDLTPRPRKLLAIRYDLDRISRLINDIHPVTSLHINQSSHHIIPAPSLPFNGRQNSRKEKNKLASRACRLKKKAQHEANKIQLSGLREEHAHMTCVVREMLQILRARLNRNGPAIAPDEATRRIEGLFSMANRQRVAGRLPEYVQSILTDNEAGRAAHHAPAMRPFIALSMIE